MPTIMSCIILNLSVCDGWCSHHSLTKYVCWLLPDSFELDGASSSISVVFTVFNFILYGILQQGVHTSHIKVSRSSVVKRCGFFFLKPDEYAYSGEFYHKRACTSVANCFCSDVAQEEVCSFVLSVFPLI